jgi:predicted NAD-dependent protein-ADP-ribosyltransferase YbiA (DUF1768 family)
MDIKKGAGYPASKLSNLAPNPFKIDGVECASMEGFLQSLKHQDPETQKHICQLIGMKAKKSGGKNWKRNQTLYWKGVAYKRDSEEYQKLLDRAYAALAKNRKFQKALLATGNAALTHSIGKRKQKDTVLTAREFTRRLEDIRTKLKNA